MKTHKSTQTSGCGYVPMAGREFTAVECTGDGSPNGAVSQSDIAAKLLLLLVSSISVIITKTCTLKQQGKTVRFT